MSRILLLSEVFPPKTGGSGRWFWEVYRRLPTENVVIAAGEHPHHVEFDRQHHLRIKRMGLTLPDWGVCKSSGRGGYWRAWRSVAKLLREHRIGEIHCGRALPEGWIAWGLKFRYRLPYACYVHGEELNYARLSRELGWMLRRVLSKASVVIANSQNTRDLLVTDWSVPLDRLRILHPGADTGRFTVAAPDFQARQALGWQGRTVVLTVGRLQRRKGQDMLIRALPLIRQEVPSLLYSIVGEGEDREYLRDLAQEVGVSDCVEFRGEPNDDELVRCYQQCDVFALPNRTADGDIEGFGMVLVEAQACGKAVVAGNSGGTRETMRVGETGVIVDCTSPESLAQAITELLLDPERREAMGSAGRAWATEQFDWEALTHRACNIFAAAAVSEASRGLKPAGI